MIKFIVCILLLSISSIESKSQTIQDLWPDAVPQAETAELTIADTLEKTDEMFFSSVEFLDPGIIKAKNGIMAIYDFGLNQFYSLDLNNTSDGVQPIGVGHGSGPGEYRSVFSIDIDENHNKYILDSELLRLTIWDANNELKSSIQLNTSKGIPGRLVVDNNTIIISFAFAGSSEYQFGILSEDGTIEKRFQKQHTFENAKSPLLYDGHSTSNDGMVLYGSINYGVFLLYNKNREAIHKRHLINPLNGLELVVQQSGNMTSTTFGSDSKIAIASLDLDEDFIYVLYSGTGSFRSDRLDLYDVDTGDYIKTLILDEIVSRITIDQQTLYASVRETETEPSKIVVYELPEN
jgi:hypothetical protein